MKSFLILSERGFLMNMTKPNENLSGQSFSPPSSFVFLTIVTMVMGWYQAELRTGPHEATRFSWDFNPGLQVGSLFKTPFPPMLLYMTDILLPEY